MLAMFDEAEILRDYVEGEIYEAEQNGAKKFAIQMLRAGKISEEELEEYFPMLSKEEIGELLNGAAQ